MTNTGIVAIIVFIVLTVIALLLPKRKFNNRIKKDMDISDVEWKHGNKLGYYKMLIGVCALITVVIMIVYKSFVTA